MKSALLTAREVADLLGVSPETVLRWTRRGDLPAIRLPGGAIRYREEDLDMWLASRATQPTVCQPQMGPRITKEGILETLTTASQRKKEE